MSVFEQCLPYKELGLDKDLTCDVLEDDEDILTQISAQLDIPSFADQEVTPQTGNYNNSLHGSFLPPIEGLESGMLDDVLMDDFAPSQYNYPDSGFSDGSIKSEPCSPGSSSQDQSPPLSPVMEYSLVTSVNTILSQPVAVNTVNSINIPTATTVNGKVAIPKLNKPLMTPAPLVTSTVTNNSANHPPPLVLVCNQTPSNGQIIVKTETVSSSGYCNPLVTGLPTVTGHSSAEDLRNLKRQQRMIKNRESACISRKKKKEYVTQLEEQIKTLSSENQLLRNENENLKEKLRDLQAEKSLWTDSIIRSSNNKKATAVLALLFMVSLNMNSLSGIYNSEENNSVAANLNKNVHSRDAGRTLLWVDDSLDNNDNNDKEFLGNITSDSSQCGGSNLNQTESIRLESDLRGWFNIDPPRNKRRPDVTRRPTRSPKKKAERRIANSAVGNVVRTPLHSLTGSVYHMLAPPPTQQNALSFFSNQQRNSFASFFDAIDRRDDTFYVVSFSGDHLLVPATNHTKTTRPLMSLLLPAVVSSNSTENQSEGHIAMMKIDCQVINTQMVHITKDAIPVHLASNLKDENNHREKNFDNEKVYATNFKKNASRTEDNGIFFNNPKKTDSYQKPRKFDAN